MLRYVQWPVCTLAYGSLLLVELRPELAVLFEDGDDHLGEDSSEVGIVGLPSCTQVAELHKSFAKQGVSMGGITVCVVLPSFSAVVAIPLAMWSLVAWPLTLVRAMA